LQDDEKHAQLQPEYLHRRGCFCGQRRGKYRANPKSGSPIPGRIIGDVVSDVINRKTTPKPSPTPRTLPTPAPTPAPKPTPKPTPKPSPTPKPVQPRSDCVDLAASDLRVDGLLKDKPQNDFNCHYYTKTFINGKTPSGLLDGSTSIIREADLRAAAYQSVPVEYDAQGRITNAHLGDVIILTGDTGTFSPYLHSAIVTNIDPRGAILSLRQKLNPEDCVAETNWEFFKQNFLSQATGVKLWSNPNRAGRLERTR